MKILVRLPNWLGDVVMSLYFLEQLSIVYPNATIDVICKKQLVDLLSISKHINKIYSFNKETHKGFWGPFIFGKSIQKQEKYDIYYCLPKSFSTALMGIGTGAKQRIGYKNELRSFLFTQSYKTPKNIHRVNEYLFLLGKQISHDIELSVTENKTKSGIVVNINSEAQSRKLPIDKATNLINDLCAQFPQTKILLIGGPKDAEYVSTVFKKLNNSNNIINYTGKTNLTELIELLQNSKLLISSDSGPAHLANYLKTNTIVLFGAGNENNTQPFLKKYCSVIRLNLLKCEPCVKNKCTKYDLPKCLLLLENTQIINEAKKFLK